MSELRALLDSIGDHVVQYDREWRYTFVTERGAAMVGKRPEELLGRSIWDLFPDAVGNDYYKALHEAAATGRIVRFEHHYAPFDKWFDNHIYPGPGGVTVFCADITERKVAELELRRAEQRHAALVEMIPAGVYWCDAEGRIQYFNKRAAELWGREPSLRDPGERYCGSFRIFTTEGAPVPHDECPMVSALRSGLPVRDQEVVIERPDGSRVTALANIQPVRDPLGAIIGAVNVFSDITDRKARDDELRRSETTCSRSRASRAGPSSCARKASRSRT